MTNPDTVKVARPRCCPTCNGIGTLPDQRGSVRIDSVRNRVNATVDVLRMALDHINDLHVLAYDRKAATGDRSARVTGGGTRDYALDTHGDPKAREVLWLLNRATIDAVEMLTVAAHEGLGLLADGKVSRRGRERIGMEELTDALDAQQRRIERGEYQPVRRVPQPAHADAVRQARTERKAVVAERKAVGAVLAGHLRRLERAVKRGKGLTAEQLSEELTTVTSAVSKLTDAT